MKIKKSKPVRITLWHLLGLWAVLVALAAISPYVNAGKVTHYKKFAQKCTQLVEDKMNMVLDKEATGEAKLRYYTKLEPNLVRFKVYTYIHNNGVTIQDLETFYCGMFWNKRLPDWIYYDRDRVAVEAFIVRGIL